MRAPGGHNASRRVSRSPPGWAAAWEVADRWTPPLWIFLGTVILTSLFWLFWYIDYSD